MDDVHAAELLRRERLRIERALGQLGPDGDGELTHLDQHLADEATELFESERDAGLAERLQAELEAIKRAQRRLETGGYGVSVESGLEIPDARLEAVPWAERTVEEQSRTDRF